MQARAANQGDAEAIARIYNQGIEERIATFETSPREPGRCGIGWTVGIPSWSWKTEGP